MVGLASGLFFGGTELIEPTGRDDYIVNGAQHTGLDSDGSDADDDVPDDERSKRDLSRAASAIPPAHKLRVPGGKAAVPKRIVAEYDSDDGRIITLKQQGYSDEYVAEKLIQEGRICYVPKTINSRWVRLRRALEEIEEQKLDDELSDWHIGEDEELQEAFSAVEKKTEIAVQKLMDGKWKEISANLAIRLHRKKYTAKACKERFDGLNDGTALLAIELDPDQEGRKQMREARIAANKQLRAEKAAQHHGADDEKKIRLAEKKRIAEEKERQKILTTRKRKADLDEADRVKKQRKLDRAAQVAARKEAEDQARAEAKWLEQRNRAERALLAKLQGKPLRAITVGTRRSARRRSHVLSDDEDEESFAGSSDGDQSELTDYESEEDQESADPSPMGGSLPKTVPVKARKPPMTTAKAKVTKETLLSPRSVMTDAELRWLLQSRGLPQPTMRESHPQIVARLAAADENLSTSELNDLLLTHFDKGKGSKAAKIQRLQQHDADNSAAGSAEVKATDPEFKKGYEGYRGEYEGLLAEE